MAWEWEIIARQARNFLLIVYPYLRLKKIEADIAIRFQTDRKNKGRKGLTDAEWAIQEAEYLLIKNLKGRKTVRPCWALLGE